MIKRRNDNIFIRFNRSFYDEKIIKKSMKDFSKTFDTNMKNNGNYFEVSIKDYDRNQTAAMEFCNYVLGMMKFENEKI